MSSRAAGAARPMATDLDTGNNPTPKLAAVPAGPTDPYASRERHHNEGHGRRLTAAFEALEAFPALAESRNHLMRLFEDADPSTAEVVAAVEGDVALAVTVLRLANRVEGRSRGRRGDRPTCGHACPLRARRIGVSGRAAQGLPGGERHAGAAPGGDVRPAAVERRFTAACRRSVPDVQARARGRQEARPGHGL